MRIRQIRLRNFWGYKNTLDLNAEREKLKLLEEEKLRASLWNSTLSESEAVSETVYHIREQCYIYQEMHERHIKSAALRKFRTEEQISQPSTASRSKSRRQSIWQSVFDEDQTQNQGEILRELSSSKSAQTVATTPAVSESSPVLSTQRDSSFPILLQATDQLQTLPTSFEIMIRDYCEANRTLGRQRLRMPFAPPHYGTDVRVLREVEDVRARYMRNSRPEVISAIESLQHNSSTQNLSSASLSSMDKRGITRSRRGSPAGQGLLSPVFPKPPGIDESAPGWTRRSVSSSMVNRIRKSSIISLNGDASMSLIPNPPPPRTAPASISRTLPPPAGLVKAGNAEGDVRTEFGAETRSLKPRFNKLFDG